MTGYYRVGGSGATWYPLNPTRLLDTRVGNGLSGKFGARVVRNVQVTGRGSIPADAIAVTGNLTATGATGSGYVSAGPTMTASPKQSTLNLVKGVTRANNVTLRLGAGGRMGLVYIGPRRTSVHLLFDVTGYYRAGDAGAEWYPIDPIRLLDTRVGNGLAGTFRDEVVRGLPADRAGDGPGRRGGGDRQPDRDRGDCERLRQHRSVDDQQADDLDAQRRGRLDHRQRPDPAARVGRDGRGRVRQRRRSADPRVGGPLRILPVTDAPSTLRRT